MKDEFEKMGKEAVVAALKTLYLHSSGGTVA
jgi:hypothetical protein